MEMKSIPSLTEAYRAVLHKEMNKSLVLSVSSTIYIHTDAGSNIFAFICTLVSTASPPPVICTYLLVEMDASLQRLSQESRLVSLFQPPTNELSNLCIWDLETGGEN